MTIGYDSRYAWGRLLAGLVIATIGGVGLWSPVAVLPTIEAEFGLGRGGASLPYTATMIGFAAGGVLMGRLADRRGIMVPLVLGSFMLALGFVAASLSQTYWQFILAQALLIGMLGSSSTFGPMVADISLWFMRRRGIAVAIVASGNYLAGAIWPRLLLPAIEAYGWRVAYAGIGIICLVTMLPLCYLLRRRPTFETAVPRDTPAAKPIGSKKEAPFYLQGLLMFAGIACCVAMSMPQVHMIAYCGDLGYGAAAGAQMLGIMLLTGVISRLASGMIADRIGGLGTLILGSTLQCLALIFYLPFDGLMSLYIVSGLFGLSQGGIVPSYALIVRDNFPAHQAGVRVSLVLMATVVGMALGGWMSGAIYDLTHSYHMAFLNGIAWNVVNMAIALWLLMRRSPGRLVAA
ncbi:MFS transporter [Dongia rigui]|uniref:MFS transporter n=1 Tax=Dongia rigui TaxID=940149 RepID=A0ABU5DWN8_9PROT|nr:MFS transporter [Dongia rigui]MDY0871689.1 MFS transporter [Dongia rigui]